MITRLRDYLVKKALVVGPNQTQTADVLVQDGTISEIKPSIATLSAIEVINGDGLVLLPGFIDIHNHGARGFDFSFGQYDHQSDCFAHTADVFMTGLRNYLEHNLTSGTTLLYPTTMAAPIEVLVKSFGWYNDFIHQHPEWSGVLGGINLEGTFLKDPAYAGAQNPRFFYAPALDLIDELQKASSKRLSIVNLPPEHGPAGVELISKMRTQNIVIAGGHTAAFGDEFLCAVKAGLTLAVHFLNGPSRRTSKGFRLGGAEEVMLREDNVYLELICDGYHVHPSYVRDVIARKGLERVIVITDSMFANGMTNLKHFSLFGLEGEVSAQAEYLQLKGTEDTLFGSVLSMDVAYQNILRWLTNPMTGVWHRHHNALSLPEALVAGSKMTSTNPARLLGLDQNYGSIEPGKKARLLLAQIIPGQEILFKLKQVFFTS